MAGGHVARIASAVHERLSFTRLQRLHDDLRLVPAIASGTCREGKQHGLSASRCKTEGDGMGGPAKGRASPNPTFVKKPSLKGFWAQVPAWTPSSSVNSPLGQLACHQAGPEGGFAAGNPQIPGPREWKRE